MLSSRSHSATDVGPRPGPDVLKRHLKSPPAACRRVEGKEVKEKRKKTKETHKEFVERLKVFMETGEKFGPVWGTILRHYQGVARGVVSRFLEKAHCGKQE